MDATQLIETVSAQLNAAAKLVGGNAWGADRGKPRVYLPSRKDMKVFFDFPDFPTGDDRDLLGGARLNVVIDDCGQSPAWYSLQRSIVRQKFRRESLALSALAWADATLAAEVMSLDPDVFTDAVTDDASHEIINGRVAEFRKAVGLD